MIDFENERHVRNLAVLLLFIVMLILFDLKIASAYILAGVTVGLIYRGLFLLYVKYLKRKD